MRLFRIALAVLLACSITACAANAGAAASAESVEASAGTDVRLRNRVQAQRLIQFHYPELHRNARVTGEVFVQLTLDRVGTPTATRVLRSSDDAFSAPALRVAQSLRFYSTGASNTQVEVRINFAEPGAGTVTIVR